MTTAIDTDVLIEADLVTEAEMVVDAEVFVEDEPSSRSDLVAEAVQSVVKGKNDDGESWKKIADVINFSGTGASFYMSCECKVGSLLLMMVPMPEELRAYDQDKEFYRVWGIVQHCQKMIDEYSGFHIGIAFIGKNPPESYLEDPSITYRISGTDEDGFWRVNAAKSNFQSRKDVRYWTKIELYLALVDGNKAAMTGERTVTENISKGGAALYTTLDLNIGDRVKFICEAYDFSGIAVVCNVNKGYNQRTRLHLKFVNCTFPIETLAQRTAANERLREAKDPKESKFSED